VPSIPERRLPVGTVTFLFTDIEGSTRLLSALGDRYPALLATHNGLLRDSIARHRGMFAFNTVLPEFIDEYARQLHSAATFVRARVGTEYHLTTLN